MQHNAHCLDWHRENLCLQDYLVREPPTQPACLDIIRAWIYAPDGASQSGKTSHERAQALIDNLAAGGFVLVRREIAAVGTEVVRLACSGSDPIRQLPLPRLGN